MTGLGFLEMLTPEDRVALLRTGRSRRYKPGTSIIVQGDTSDSLFLIRAGSVKVTRGTADGHEVLLTVLGPGEVFGEFEAIDRNGGPRAASVIALDAVDCRVFTPDEFDDFLTSRPRAAYELLRAIIQRLRAADRRRTDSGSADVGHHLARFLLELADERGRAGPGGIDIELAVTQGELASQIAASRESAVRALTRLRSQGLIATGRRRITILDADGLRAYAESE